MSFYPEDPLFVFESVRFGAKGDGVTDDTLAILEAWVNSPEMRRSREDMERIIRREALRIALWGDCPVN